MELKSSVKNFAVYQERKMEVVENSYVTLYQVLGTRVLDV